ncbi:MAG: VCBS repeat-containing protein [Saprospiraceae bacterium]
MNNDGYIDLVGLSGNSSLGQNTISVLINNGDGTFQSQQTFNTSVFGHTLEIADIDNDGDGDVLYTSSTSFSSSPYFRVYENDGKWRTYFI